MKIFNKDNLDFFSTSPGNYIFKNKANKSEFGKFSSIFHLLASLVILIYYLYIYITGKEMTIIYSKKNKLPKKGNDEYKYYNESNKNYKIYLETFNEDEILNDFLDFTLEGENINIIGIYGNKNQFIIEFTSPDVFYFGIKKINDSISSNFLFFGFLHSTSSMNDEDKKELKENDFKKSESFLINLKKLNKYAFKKNYIVYRDGYLVKTLKNFLFFWKQSETTYIDFYYNNYVSYSFDIENIDYTDNYIAEITNDNSATIEGEDIIVDYYERKYVSLFNFLTRWCGIFSIMKILFSSLVNEFSFTYNNYELIKYINKKNEMNKTIILSKDNNNNNNNSINKMKTIDLNKIDNKTKYFNKIKTKDIIKYTFFGCCYKKSKTHKFINDCNNYVTQHISIEEIFYNMLCLENIIEEYKFKDNNHLKKYEEMKNKIETYENEMDLLDKSKDNINPNLNSNLIDKSSNSISLNNISSIND